MVEAEEIRTRRALLHMLEDLQREQHLALEARRQWVETVDALRDPLLVHDRDYRVVRCNKAYLARCGGGFPDVIGKLYWDCFPKGQGAGPNCRAGVEQDLPASEDEIVLATGEIFQARCFAVRDSGSPQWLTLFEDVTEKRRSEKRIRTLNTQYATLSAVNHAIVHSKSRHEICERIARISTEVGMWHGAWIGFADLGSGRVVAEAWSDSMTPHLGKMAMSVDEALPEGQGPCGHAMRSGVTYFCNDLFADPVTLPARGFAEAFGINAMAAIPLMLGRSAPGIVNLYSKDKEIFTPEVRALVVEMGDDITFALDMLDTERQRQAAEAALLENQAKLRRGLEATVEAIAATVETRDPYTAGHQRRVASLARAIGAEMGLPPSALEGIHFGALVHDLGKIQIPAEILAKPTRLSKLEFELIKTHSQAGYDIIKGIDFPWPVAAMVHQHHERLDGSGYPRGLKGEEIALEARILAVADVVEAMASHRPYRPSLGIEPALKEIEEKRGRWFDSAAVDACLRLFREKGFRLEGVG